MQAIGNTGPAMSPPVSPDPTTAGVAPIPTGMSHLPAVQISDDLATLPPPRPMMITSPAATEQAPLPVPMQLPAARGTARGTVGYVVAALLGVVVAGAVGVGGLFAWKITRRADPPAVVATEAPPATTSLTTAASPPKGAGLASAPSSVPTAAATASGPTASKEIEFQVMPEEAVLIIDGASLPANARSIPRPPKGTIVTVVVRAPGFQDEEVKIDDGVPAQVPVILTASPSAAPAATATFPGYASTAPPGLGTAPAGKATTIIAPPNPYKKN